MEVRDVTQHFSGLPRPVNISPALHWSQAEVEIVAGHVPAVSCHLRDALVRDFVQSAQESSSSVLLVLGSPQRSGLGARPETLARFLGNEVLRKIADEEHLHVCLRS